MKLMLQMFGKDLQPVSPGSTRLSTIAIPDFILNTHSTY